LITACDPRFFSLVSVVARLDRLQQIPGPHRRLRKRERMQTREGRGASSSIAQQLLHRPLAVGSRARRERRRRGGGREEDSRAVGKTTGESEGAGERGPHLASPGRHVAKGRWEEMAPELDPPEAVAAGPSSICQRPPPPTLDPPHRRPLMHLALPDPGLGRERAVRRWGRRRRGARRRQ
jgi:hypothetical protein